MAATTILRAIETKGRRGGEKKRKTGCMQAYFFLTSCLPLLYLNTRTSLPELSVISNFQIGEGTL